MRKIIKTPIVALSFLSLLTSCGNTSYAGLYGFQMGKDNGTHFGLYLNLTDTFVTLDSEPEVTNKYKYCDFMFSVKFSTESGSFVNIISKIAALLGQEGQMISIPAYWYQGDGVAKDGAVELKLGFDFSLIEHIFGDIDLQGIDIPSLTPAQIEKIIYTTYLNNTVTMYIPVSEVDLICQLYWYGIDFTYSEEEGLNFVESPYGVHNPGSHPKAEDIQAINEIYNYEETHKEFAEKFDINLGKYRDYYTLAMGLAKK